MRAVHAYVLGMHLHVARASALCPHVFWACVCGVLLRCGRACESCACKCVACACVLHVHVCCACQICFSTSVLDMLLPQVGGHCMRPDLLLHKCTWHAPATSGWALLLLWRCTHEAVLILNMNCQAMNHMCTCAICFVHGTLLEECWTCMCMLKAHTAQQAQQICSHQCVEPLGLTSVWILDLASVKLQSNLHRY